MAEARAAAAVVLALAAATAAAPGNPELREQVRATEAAFARTMADRDFSAFSAFLAADTVFFGRSDVPMRGKAAVETAWRRFYEGAAAPFAWAPEVVEVLDSGDLAFSFGPVFDPAGNRVGTFNSVWRRQPDGRWLIVFDKGCPPCAAPTGY